MADEDYEDDYEEATDEQKLSIATYFIMSSPVGEVDFVLADTSKLIGSEEILSPTKISAILKDYNIDVACQAKTPDGGQSLITSYGMVSDTEFIDPRSGKILIFDHSRREFVGDSDKKQDLPTSIAAQRKAVEKEVDTYIETTYKPGKCVAVVYASESGDITVCISAVNTKISAYWTGGWNSTFSVNVSESGPATLEGDCKVHVHYFEDGNVQLHSAINKKYEVTVGDPASTAKSIAKQINKIESDYQTNLEDMYVDMHRTTFKEMRRFLPINKQPMEWSPYAHGVGLMK